MTSNDRLRYPEDVEQALANIKFMLPDLSQFVDENIDTLKHIGIGEPETSLKEIIKAQKKLADYNRQQKEFYERTKAEVLRDGSAKSKDHGLEGRAHDLNTTRIAPQKLKRISLGVVAILILIILIWLVFIILPSFSF